MNNEKTLSKLTKIILEECFELGLNTAHDYDGIENNEDLIIYTKAVIKKLKSDGTKRKDSG